MVPENQSIISDGWCVNSTYCESSQDVNNGIKGKFTFSVNYCTNNLYFAIVPLSTGSSSNATIQVVSSDCIHIISPDNNAIVPCNDFSMGDLGCASRSPLDARTFCIPGCVVLDCLNNNSEATLSLVVPKTLTEAAQNDRCTAAAGFVDKKITDSCQNNSIIEDLSIGEIVIISFVVFMLLCCISTIVYYNYKVTLFLQFYQTLVLQD